MDVLYHHDSAWGLDDFELAPLRSTPALQPQLRLPSISTSLNDGHQETQSIDPAVLNGFSGYESFEQSEELGDPSPQHFDHFAEYAPTSSAVQGLNITSSYEDTASFRHEARYPEQWDAQEDENGWTDAYFSHRNQYRPSDRPPSPASDGEAQAPTSSLHQHHPGATSELIPSPEPISPHTLSSRHSFSEPSVLGAPYAIPIGQPAIDMPPPPRKRSRKSSADQIKTERPDKSDRKKQTPARRTTVKQMPSMPRPETARSATKTTHPKFDAGGVFIHGLCGKGFASRSKVKKHHWGNLYDNLDTTTGCWAKHNKPDVSWDDHASCKHDDHKSQTLEETSNLSVLAHKSTDSPKVSDRKAVVVSTMIPIQSNVLPGFQTSHDLPRTASHALHVPRSALHEMQYQDHSYYDNRMRSASKFESLLTAVDVASRIEAPILKGRNDSVVTHLDAQVVAAELNGKFTSQWPFPSRGLDERFSYSQPYPPFLTDPTLGHSIPRPNIRMPAYNVFPGYTFPSTGYTQTQPNFGASMIVPSCTDDPVHRSALRERGGMDASTSPNADNKRARR